LSASGGRRGRGAGIVAGHVSQRDRERLHEGLRRWSSLHALAFDPARCWIQHFECEAF
jgi:hypothetical protein